MSMSQTGVTCIVPTHNRPNFLRRLLELYTEIQPGFQLLIIDSSDAISAAENANTAAKTQLNISYQHRNDDFVGKCSFALQQIETPFVIFCADDDFLFPDAVHQSAAFLSHSINYASALGRTVLLNTTPRRLRSKLKVLKGYSVEHDRPLDRCRKIAERFFSNFYAVHRTEQLLENFRITAASTDSLASPHLPELMLLHLSVMRGKVKVLPVMHSIWQRHGSNASTTRWASRLSNAEGLYQRFKGSLADQFENVGTERREAERFVDDRYGYFRNPDMASWRGRISVEERFGRIASGLLERAVDFLRTDQTRHCRAVRTSDYAGQEATWQAAINRMTKFPQGVGLEPMAARCA